MTQTHYSDLVYAGDTMLYNWCYRAHSLAWVSLTPDVEKHCDRLLSSFSAAASMFGLQVLWPKTRLQNLGTGVQLPTTSIDGSPVDSLDSFVCLGTWKFLVLGRLLLSRHQLTFEWRHQPCLPCVRQGGHKPGKNLNTQGFLWTYDFTFCNFCCWRLTWWWNFSAGS